MDADEHVVKPERPAEKILSDGISLEEPFDLFHRRKEFLPEPQKDRPGHVKFLDAPSGKLIIQNSGNRFSLPQKVRVMKISMNEGFGLSIRPITVQEFFRIIESQRLKMQPLRQIKKPSLPDERTGDRQAVQLCKCPFPLSPRQKDSTGL